jgi:FKBP-type peptidyl-prolyl cis-trans isomerase SlyD
VRVERGAVVTLRYDIRDPEGNPLDEEDARMAYLHGYGGIFPKVEEALEGKDVGEEVALTLEPADAFGEYDADLLRVEPRDRFPETLKVGMRFEGVPGNDEEESRIYTVSDITDEAVVVDANHEYAGQRIWFKCRVEDVRRATAEEIEHGHVHGDTGLATH